MSVAELIAVVVTLAYFAFYTAYDKGKKKLTLANLRCLVLLEKGLDWTLVEINKVLSLAGLTLMLLAFLPHFPSFLSDQMLQIAFPMLGIHFMYSVYKFYGFSPRNFLKEVWYKQLSIVLGLCAFFVLGAGSQHALAYTTFVLLGVVLSLAHFYTMEMDYKYEIQIRPFAMLPFPLGTIVLLYLVRSTLL